MVEDERRNPPDLADIDARLRAARPQVQGDDGREGGGPARMSGLGLAARIGIELVTTVLVGVAIGWALDEWLGTKPWFMVVFLFLGGAAGVTNVYRVVRGLDDSVGLGGAVERKQRSGDDGEGPGA
ncbi:AtpZ/AtpI family protein [Novispirillum sp. DQ9]|uniref:AtpZ/AtpI family protein n=1 Tax=Novispirillum sp. DQ9 TaxID=3398612 RepID=UPI003C7E40F5